MSDPETLLNEELKALKQTINLSNPLYQGHVNDWKSYNVKHSELTTREDQLYEENPLIKRRSLSSRASTPLVNDKVVSKLIHDLDRSDLGSSCSSRSSQLSEDDVSSVKSNSAPPPAKKIPRAKQSHMDGILHGLPGMKSPAQSTTAEAFEYSNQMKKLVSEKDKHSFRKKDKYSDYVEARARFSKMHSVS